MVTVLLGALSVALTLGGNAFAVVDVARERYCPVPVSWAGWAVLMLEGGGGTLAGSVTSALYVLTCAAGCFAVAVLALRIPRERREDPVRLPGSWPLVGGTRLDWICGPAAAGFLIVLAITRDPAWAVVVTIAADLILYVPTYGHGWRHPHDEAPLAYGRRRSDRDSPAAHGDGARAGAGLPGLPGGGGRGDGGHGADPAGGRARTGGGGRGAGAATGRRRRIPDHTLGSLS